MSRSAGRGVCLSNDSFVIALGGPASFGGAILWVMPDSRLTGGVRKEASTGKLSAPQQRCPFSRCWPVVVCAALAGLGLWTGHLLHSDNFHAIVAGEAYRSGQMRSNDL